MEASMTMISVRGLDLLQGDLYVSNGLVTGV